jgi:hypothetical protein
MFLAADSGVCNRVETKMTLNISEKIRILGTKFQEKKIFAKISNSSAFSKIVAKSPDDEE